MQSVIVLLSTYNGEKYLSQQIDSLLSQKGVAVHILVRDDGSNDSTLSILEKYSSENTNFEYYEGKNCGPAKSFLDLIQHAGEADYYALCDQDDVWDDDKLLIAVEKLASFDSEKPALYYSNLRIVDENLKFFRLSHTSELFNPNRYSALTENLCTGCTAVFNYRAKEMISDKLPDYCTMHDTWIYMVCKLLGNTYYDSEAHISYRQHGNNVVGTYLNKNNGKIMKERFLRLFKRDLQPRYMNAISFDECFASYMNDVDRSKVLKIVHYKDSLKDRLNLLFDNEIKASSFYGNLRFKVHILWGTV